jgi:hypothetical protein
MIITKKKDKETVLRSVKDFKSVYLFGCNTCAEQCSTGGEKEILEMTALLTEAGHEVAGSSLIDETCYLQLVKREYRQKAEIAGADAVLVLSCGAGVKCVAESAKDTQPVLPALDSIYLAKVDRVGRFQEGCSLCGECVLADTGGICPHTDCPKGMLNGPCGGVADGKCEVNTDNDCAWVLIFDRLKAQGRLSLMEAETEPKDHTTEIHPRSDSLR